MQVEYEGDEIGKLSSKSTGQPTQSSIWQPYSSGIGPENREKTCAST